MTPASPFAHRFNTYFQPTSEERGQIRKIISANVDEHERLETLIYNLTIKQNMFQKHIEQHRQLISPIHNIPVEILQMIFYYCLPSGHNAVMSVRELPLLLGRVCRVWRQISYSTPQLWSTIHINHRNPFTAPFGSYCHAVEAWLHRSSNLPLSISLADTCGGLTLLRMLIQILFAFSPRWKNLALSLKSYHYFGGVEAIDAPILRAAIIDIPGSPNEEALAAFSFLHTPSLRSVSVSYISALPFFRWESITDLSVGSPEETEVISVEQALEIFRACPNLVSCMLEVDIDCPCDTNVISLLHLHVLRLELYLFIPVHDVAPFIATFLGVLDAPNLKYFDFTTAQEPTLIVPFKPFLERLPSLTTLEYTIGGVPAEEIAAALALSPSLRCLRLAVDDTIEGGTPGLRDSSLSCALLALLHAHAQTPLLPALEHLDISTDIYSDITEDSLLQLILSRTDDAPAGIARLKRVCFAFGRTRRGGLDIIPELTCAIANGLQVQITYLLLPVVKPGTPPAVWTEGWEMGFWDSDL